MSEDDVIFFKGRAYLRRDDGLYAPIRIVMTRMGIALFLGTPVPLSDIQPEEPPKPKTLGVSFSGTASIGKLNPDGSLDPNSVQPLPTVTSIWNVPLIPVPMKKTAEGKGNDLVDKWEIETGRHNDGQ